MVTLYRDHHAWCPDCQKIWLWLEFKRIPVPDPQSHHAVLRPEGAVVPGESALRDVAGLELNGRLITESDDILLALEQQFPWR